MAKYHTWINGGSLGRTVLTADNLAEAHAEACEWALDGDWEGGADDVRVTTWPVAGGDIPDIDMIESAGYETPLESTVRVGEEARD
jgi:hypothetical protein